MRLDDDDFKKYPLCAHYIRQFLGNPDTFKSKYTNVWNSMLHACQIDMKPDDFPDILRYCRQALTMGDGPLVQISSRLDKDEAGNFRPMGGTSDDIFRISTEVADSYEHDTGWMVLEGTVLHESVHWVRYQIGGSGNTILPRQTWTSQGEAGDVFECLAYGFNTSKRGANGKLIPYGPPETLPTKKECRPSPIPML